MQQDNTIENKLRQLDASEQPDLQHMEAHWQQMQAMLQPAATPIKKGWPRWMLNGLTAAAVVILITAAWWLMQKNNGSNKQHTDTTTATAETSKQAASANITATDASSTQTDTTVLPVNATDIADNSIAQKQYNDWQEEDSLFATMKINYSPCNTCPAADSITALSTTEREKLLAALFAETQQEKTTQTYAIDNRRDSLLLFKEGTAILVPAGSFGNKAVILDVKEFYKTSDIILHQLSTESNKNQLITGGMLYITATSNGQPVNINPAIPLTLYMPDTSSAMNQMQLFNGVVENGKVNWMPQGRPFSRKQVSTEVKVFNLVDQPFKVTSNEKGETAYFIYNEDSIRVDKEELKAMLKAKYGYRKVKLKSGIRNWFKVENGDREFDRRYATNIGDSVWMEKKTAERYQLKGSQSRIIVNDGNNIYVYNQATAINIDFLRMKQGLDTAIIDFSEITKNSNYNAAILGKLDSKYGVALNKMGWINCDRFLADSRSKINYTVDLGHTASCFSTMLVFDNFRSIMSGFTNGNQVMFNNLPVGEPVTVVSIGIDQKGNAQLAVQKTIISNTTLSNLKYETVSTADLKTTLSKMDQ